MSAKVDVVVRKEGKDVARRANMPVRKRPDGTAGVIWSRRVYPLRPDCSIELSDESLDKGECPAHFNHQEKLRYVETQPLGMRYFLERTRSKAYLVFDGDEEYASRIERAFKEVGLSAGYGESFRPAKDGNFYDWFIRLPAHVEDQLVAEIMTGTVQNVQDPSGNEKNEESLLRALLLQTGLDLWGLIERMNTLTSERDEALSECNELREEAASLRIGAARTEACLQVAGRSVAALESSAASLVEENRALRQAAVEGTREAEEITGAIARLDARLRQSEETREGLQRDLSVLIEKAEQSEQEASELRSQLKLARQQLGDLEREQAEPAILPPGYRTGNSGKEAKRLLDAVCRILLPNIKLHDSDRKHLLTEFYDPSDCLSYLRRLSEGAAPPEAKGFQGVKGVWEIGRVRTGRPECASNGRIYYRKHAKGFDVALHVKKDETEQERFVRGRFKQA